MTRCAHVGGKYVGGYKYFVDPIGFDQFVLISARYAVEGDVTEYE